MTKAVWGARIRRAGAAVLLLGSISCGDLSRQGSSPAYLLVDILEAASGAEPATFGADLRSDVVTVVDDVPSTFNDVARVQFSLGMKDPGAPGTPNTPTSANFITINRYRVTYIRTDGRNTPGVDVPYGFDSAFTLTVADSATAGFTIVRHQAKQEAPLAALRVNPILISTIAEVTFYGQDQTGRAVTAVARIGISFGNFGDPQ
jgi:hypothetical protein